jgi:WD40 repeat protein
LLAFVDNSERLPAQVKTAKILIDGRFNIEISSNTNPGLPRVKIWDVPGWKDVAGVDGGLPLSFSRDGKVLATGDRNWRTPVAKLWDTGTGRLRLELKDRAPGLWPITFSPDGRFLASGEHGDKSLWELADGRRWAIGSKGTGSSSRGPAFSPDGRLLFPNGLTRMHPQMDQGGEHSCYNLTTMPPKRLELGSGEVVISPDGRRYAAVLGKRWSGVPLTVVLHDLPSLGESGRFEVAGLMGADFSPDGRWLALLVGRHEVVPPGSAAQWVLEIRLLDPATARVLATIPSPGQTWGNYGWKFSPDGKYLAVDYRTGSNVSGPGEPDPSDRPMNLDLWELPPR